MRNNLQQIGDGENPEPLKKPTRKDTKDKEDQK